MAAKQQYDIAVFDGDGIGLEIIPPTLELIDLVLRKLDGPKFNYQFLPAGAQNYADTGEALPQASVDAAKSADAILLSAMGLPHIRKEDGTEITPQIELRFLLDLYAGVRPVKVLAGDLSPLGDARVEEIDFVLIRESTEGLFAYMNEGEIVGDEYATETLKITRAVSEKLFDFSFKLARQRAKARKLRGVDRPPQVTCVDKANVFRSFWFFRQIFKERAKSFPDVQTDSAYVDAFAMWMVQRPWAFDVVVTENMFGDILSDLGAGLLGTLGLAPSADIGDNHAVFQPCHGTAPDIAGKGIANPSAMFLSAAMMLEWLGAKFDDDKLIKGSILIEDALTKILRKGGDTLTGDLGGKASTREFTNLTLSQIGIPDKTGKV